jgi:hypothetical protein
MPLYYAYYIYASLYLLRLLHIFTTSVVQLALKHMPLYDAYYMRNRHNREAHMYN